MHTPVHFTANPEREKRLCFFARQPEQPKPVEPKNEKPSLPADTAEDFSKAVTLEHAARQQAADTKLSTLKTPVNVSISGVGTLKVDPKTFQQRHETSDLVYRYNLPNMEVEDAVNKTIDDPDKNTGTPEQSGAPEQLKGPTKAPNPNLEKLQEAAKKFKEAGPEDFLSSLSEVVAALRDYLLGKKEVKKEAAASEPESTPETSGEKAPEVKDERENRVKEEFKESGFKTAAEFREVKEKSVQNERLKYDKKIDAEQARIEEFDEKNDQIKKKLRDAEQEVNKEEVPADVKDDLNREIRDMKDEIAANEKQIQNSEQDIKDYMEKRNTADDDVQKDIEVIDTMMERANVLLSVIRDVKEKTGKNESVQKNSSLLSLYTGIDIALQEGGLDVSVSLTKDAKSALDTLARTMNISIEGLVTEQGVVTKPLPFLETLTKILAVALESQPKKTETAAKAPKTGDYRDAYKIGPDVFRQNADASGTQKT